MAPNAENIFKYVLSKDFNEQKFIAKYFSTFWKDFYEYLKSNNKENEKGVFGKKYVIDFLKLQQTLEKVLPFIKAGSYQDATRYADDFFAILLHPNSPEQIRSQFSDIYIDFLDTCSGEELQDLKTSFGYFVPISKIGDGDFQEYIDASTPIIITENQTECTANEVPKYLEKITKYMVNDWAPRPGYIMKLFTEYVILPLYRSSAKIKSCGEARALIDDLVPIEVHTVIIKFFDELFSNDFDFSCFTKNIDSLVLIPKIILVTKKMKSLELKLDSISVLAKYLSYSQIRNAITVSDDNTTAILDIIFIITGGSEDDRLFDGIAEIFIQLFIEENFDNKEKYMEFIKKILEKTKANRVTYEALLAALIFTLFDEENDDVRMWELVVTCVSESKANAAVASKFAQLAAVMKYPQIYEFDKETVIDECLDTFMRSKKNKVTTPYDFIGENMKLIIKEPTKFVRENLVSFWEPFSECDKHLKLRNLTHNREFVKLSENLSSAIDVMIKSMLKYKTFITEDAKHNLFGVALNYYGTLNKLRIIPPGIEFNHLNIYHEIVRPLIEASVDEEDVTINKEIIKILGPFINSHDIKAHVTEKFLYNWYFILSKALLSKDEEMNRIGIKEGSATVCMGMPGSGILISMILNRIKDLADYSDAATSLLSSVPLLRVNHQFNVTLYEKLFVYIKQNNFNYIENWMQYIASKNTFGLALEAVKKIYDHNEMNEKIIKCLVEVGSAFVTDEIVHNTENPMVITWFFDLLKKPISKKSVASLTILNSFSNLSQDLQRICPKEYTDLIIEALTIADQITTKTDPVYVFNYVNSMTSILVSAHAVAVENLLVNRFQDFIERFINETDFPSDYPPQVKQMCESSLKTISLFLGRYPFPDSPCFPSSRYEKKDTQKLTLLMPNETFIIPDKITDQETGANGASYVVQTTVGQFVWEMYPMYDFFGTEPHVSLNLPEGEGSFQIPKASDDPLQKEFTSVFEQTVSEIEKNFNVEYNVDRFTPQESDGIESIIKEIEEESQNYCTIIDDIEPLKIRPPVNNFRETSAGLYCAGLVDMEKPEHVMRTTQNDNVGVLCSKTINSSHRSRAKAALAYVKEGAYEQGKILSTTLEETSPRFREFMGLLGWNVKLKNFPCYAGGLDITGDRNGESSIYTNGFDYEIMYHCAQLMPTKPKDPQQIDKKKHVGNDYIQVIFVESDREYEALTITSQFNFLTIIVYPLQTGLYQIKLQHREGMDLFGPLNVEKIVTKESLSHLINTTIIAVMRQLWNITIPYSHPLFELDNKVPRMFQFAEKEGEPYDTVVELQSL